MYASRNPLLLLFMTGLAVLALAGAPPPAGAEEDAPSLSAPKKPQIPLRLSGQVQVVRTAFREQLTFSWQGVLDLGDGYNDFPTPTAAVYGDVYGTFGVGGGGSDSGMDYTDVWTYRHGGRGYREENVTLGLLGTTSGSQVALRMTAWTVRHRVWTNTRDGYSIQEENSDIVELPAGARATAPFTLSSRGDFKVTFNQTVSSGGITYKVTGSFTGKAGWLVRSDKDPAVLDQGPVEVTMEAKGVPPALEKSIRWSGEGVPKNARGRTVKVRYTKPGLFLVTASYQKKRRARSVSGKGGKSTVRQTFQQPVVKVTFEDPYTKSNRIARDEHHEAWKLPSSLSVGTRSPVTLQAKVEGKLKKGQSIHLECPPTSGNLSGRAKVDPTELTKGDATTPVKLFGVKASEPGQGAPTLALKATVKDPAGRETEVGKTQPFFVCPHPVAVTYHIGDKFLTGGDVPGKGILWGVPYLINWPNDSVTSDSGSLKDLDRVLLAEDISIGPATGIFPLTNPVDTSTSFGDIRGQYIDYHCLTGPASVMKDLFRRVLGTAPNGDAGQEVAYQTIRFSCERCGIPAQKGVSPPIQGSGFAISYQAYKSDNRYFLRIRKSGAGNRGAKAGLVDNEDWHTIEIK